MYKIYFSVKNNVFLWSGVVTQLAELLTPEVRGSNPVIHKIHIEYCLLSTVKKRRK